jgi:HD superfamily phosphohydrolase
MIIRDPIYNYLYLTDIEQRIVDHPLFQRLRYISQNGSAYYTYPSNRSCRFLHSIGTMEVAGQIVASAFKDIGDSSVKSFLDEFYHEIESTLKTIMGKTDQAVRKMKGAMKSDNLEVYQKYGISFEALEEYIEHKPHTTKETAILLFTKIVIFQSVRIAALLHDLGHFPFSHTLEKVFEEIIVKHKSDCGKVVDCFLSKLGSAKGAKALHEKIGVCLLGAILPEYNMDYMDYYDILCKIIASKILAATEKLPSGEPVQPIDKLVGTLHTIVSGSLDADRLDYCSRDPKLSGLELGAFDLTRITSNMMLVLENDRYYILPNCRSIGALESFYHQRYLIYKYLLYHHNKSRMDCLIGRIVYMLVVYYCKKEPVFIHTFLKNRHFDYLWEHCDDEEFFKCNESWLLALIGDLKEEVEQHQDYQADNDLNTLLEMIDTFLYRKTNNLYSLFKRREMYNEFIDKVAEEIKQPAEKVKEYITAFSLQCDENIFREISKEHSVVIFYTIIKPKTIFNDDHKIDVKIAKQNDKTGSIEDYSPYLASLIKCLQEDQTFHIFLFKENIKKDSGQTGGIRDELVKLFSASIKDKCFKE